jgi:hypothetical protein
MGRVGPGREDRTMTRQLIYAAVLVAMVVNSLPPANADPTPPPSPYQIPGPSGPVFPGTQTYPPQCARNMLACGFRYHPDTGTWQPGTGSP